MSPSGARLQGHPAQAERLFVQCGLGLEEALADELLELGHRATRRAGGCDVEGPAKSYEVANLWLRTANRVLLRVGEVAAPAALRTLPLDQFLPRGGATKLSVSGLRTEPWEESARRCFGLEVRAASAPEAEVTAGLEIFLRVKDGRCSVSVDTSGALLHFRGYRQEVGRAPMRETLAAGILRLARWAPAEPLWDLMCGSGTLVIEGAERAAGLAAGRSRCFAFEGFPSHDAPAWAARSRQGEVVPTVLRGSDQNAGALGVARRNARRAGILDLVNLERLDATRLPQPAAGTLGLVVANLPYGKRVGARSELGQLYRSVGASLRSACAGWRYALLLQEGHEQLGLQVDKVFPIANGGLRCLLVTGRVG